MNAIKRQYSLECWNEIVEELILTYSTVELELIKEWLTGMCWKTNYSDMLQKAQALWENDENGKKLLLKFNDLMRDLYKAGVIGNYRKTASSAEQRWYFRGDETLLKNQEILIHQIFAPVLSTVNPE